MVDPALLAKGGGFRIHWSFFWYKPSGSSFVASYKNVRTFRLFSRLHSVLAPLWERETFGIGTPLRRHYASHAISLTFQLEKRLLLFLMAFGVVLQLIFLETLPCFCFNFWISDIFAFSLVSIVCNSSWCLRLCPAWSIYWSDLSAYFFLILGKMGSPQMRKMHICTNSTHGWDCL